MGEIFTGRDAGYQIFLLVTLILWPFVIGGLLFAMSKVESRLERTEASTPEEAGLEPVAGAEKEREVRIVFGDQVVGSPDGSPPQGRRADREAPEHTEASH